MVLKVTHISGHASQHISILSLHLLHWNPINPDEISLDMFIYESFIVTHSTGAIGVYRTTVPYLILPVYVMLGL